MNFTDKYPLFESSEKSGTSPKKLKATKRVEAKLTVVCEGGKEQIFLEERIEEEEEGPMKSSNR